jgi:hypothetical protein
MMLSIIQEKVEKINTSLNRLLSIENTLSLCVSALFLGGMLVYIAFEDTQNTPETVYTEGEASSIISAAGSGKAIVASSKGKTYFYSWCKGAGNISAKNKITFPDEGSAKASGRTLSKTCK